MSNRKHRRKNNIKKSSSFTLKIPFISDKVNHQITRILRRNSIPARLVNPRSQTIRDLARPKKAKRDNNCTNENCPAPGICKRSSVVYLATCSVCNESYVGMTIRKLHDRATEHLRSARQRSNKTALGDHYRNKHPHITPSIKFEILAHERDILRLHIEEAMAIEQLKPTLNRRRETLGTGFLV